MITTELMDFAIIYLDIQDIRNIIKAYPIFKHNFPILCKIISAINDLTIYQDKKLLTVAYTLYKNLIVQFSEVKEVFKIIGLEDLAMIHKTRYKDFVIYFENWDELYASTKFKNTLKLKAVVELLFQAQNLEQKHMFYCAIFYGATSVVSKLLNDFDVVPFSDTCQFLNVAIQEGHLDIVRLLLKDSHFNPSYNDNMAIGIASKSGLFEITCLLLQDPRVDPSADNNYAICMACENGHLSIVELLLKDSRVDPSDEGNWCIQSAAQNGHLEIVNTLLRDQRIDPSADDNFAIRMALHNAHDEIVAMLLQDNRMDSFSDQSFAIRLASLRICMWWISFCKSLFRYKYVA